MKSEDVIIHEVSDGYTVQIDLGNDKYKYRHYKTLVGAEKYRKKMITWGGSRTPGEGKKLGRPTVPDKKIKVCFSLEPEIVEYLNKNCIRNKMSKSGFLEFIIYSHAGI